MYDPSSRVKQSLKKMQIRDALAELGATTFPVMEDVCPVHVSAFYHINNDRKDVDNLLKLSMDVMQCIVFGNERFVYGIHATKILH